MSMRTYTRAFAAGELSPQLFGRLDLAKFQTGLAKCLNFQVTPQGPVQNRPGFRFVQRVRSNVAVLIPFSFNALQTFALEFGPGYIRFHTNGATLLEAPKNITAVSQASPGVFTSAAHGFAIGNWLQLGTMPGMPQLSGRWVVVDTVPTANTFTLTDLFGAPISTAGLGPYTGGGTAARVYEVLTPYTAADLFDLHYVQSADVLTICHQNHAPRELRRLGATNWTINAVSFGPRMAAPGVPGIAAYGPGGGPVPPETLAYVATSVDGATGEESLAGPAASTGWNLSVSGNYVDVQPSWVTPQPPARLNVYKLNGVYGYVGQVTPGAAFRDANVQPDTSKTPPQAFTPFASESPRAVSYFEQRRCFGGGGVNPQTIWMTRSGTESNLTYSIPSQDDDAITARIVAREAQVVRHLVPLGDLLALTSGGVWRITSSDGGPITPASFSARPQSYIGASNVQPVVTSNSVLYAPDRGSHIREVRYSWETQTFQADDISVLAPHLFDYESIVQLAYSRAPLQTLWAVRGDGILLGLTHVPEHEVKAWHQHDTQGAFESVCAVAEGDEDGVYVIVRREVNGQTVRYIERMSTRQFETVEDAFFVDAGATYAGAPTSTISGLHHLEGKQVVALADGGVETAKTVTGGSITLDAPASKVHVGLAYSADFQSMPLALEGAAALGQGPVKNINKVLLRVRRSSGVAAGPTFDNLRSYDGAGAGDDDFDDAAALEDGIIEIRLSPKWQRDGQVCVRQANPLPLTILSMTLEVATGG